MSVRLGVVRLSRWPSRGFQVQASQVCKELARFLGIGLSAFLVDDERKKRGSGLEVLRSDQQLQIEGGGVDGTHLEAASETNEYLEPRVERLESVESQRKTCGGLRRYRSRWLDWNVWKKQALSKRTQLGPLENEGERLDCLHVDLETG